MSFALAVAYDNYGEKESDLPIKNGRIDHSQKKLENICCLVAFLIALLIFVIFFFYSVATQNMDQWSHPVAYNGRICGLKHKVNNTEVDNTGTPYLYYTSPSYKGRGWCVSECPTLAKPCMIIGKDPQTGESGCTKIVEEDYIARQDYCVPKSTVEKSDDEWSRSVSSYLNSFVKKIYFPVLGFLISVVFTFIFFAFMCFCASCCIWTCIIGGIALIFLLGLVLLIVGVAADSLGDGKYLFIILGILLMVLALIFLLVVWCCVDRIKLAIALIAEAAAVIFKMPLLTVTTGLGSICSTIFSIIIALGAILFVSSYDIEVNQDGISPNISGFGFLVLILVVLFYFWIEMFVIGLTQTTIGGAVSSWYFLPNKDDLESFPICRSFWRALRYHSGAISFGSLIIAVIKTLVLLCKIAEADLKSQDGAAAAILALIVACMRCLLEYVQRYLEFLTARVYVLITIKGGGFYERAKETLFLLLRNLLRTVVLEDILTMVLGIAELLIFVASTFFLILMIRPDVFGLASKDFIIPKSWVLLIIAGILLILFAVDVMFEAYYFTVTSLFIDFLVDEEMAQTNPNYHFAARPELAQHMNTVSKKGYAMAKDYKDKHEDFNLAYYAEPPETYQAPVYAAEPAQPQQQQYSPASMPPQQQQQPYTAQQPYQQQPYQQQSYAAQQPYQQPYGQNPYGGQPYAQPGGYPPQNGYPTQGGNPPYGGY